MRNELSEIGRWLVVGSYALLVTRYEIGVGMITTRVTVQIDRPVAEVFAFVTQPGNFPRRAGALVKESLQTSAE